MERIASFQIDHDLLQPGMYLSRTDGDVVTYDVRFVRPNTPPFLPNGAMHTIEHLAATYLRNDPQWKEKVLYFGPMGCRPGFYLPLAGDWNSTDILPLVKNCFRVVANYEGDIPGATRAGIFMAGSSEKERILMSALNIALQYNKIKLSFVIIR